ncbi:MAG: glycosyltransferase 87 family protein [Thermodesulfobacteriota bacterium]
MKSAARYDWVWVVSLSGLVSGGLAMGLLSSRFGGNRGLVEKPVLGMAAVYVFWGVAYFLPVWKARIGWNKTPVRAGSPSGERRAENRRLLVSMIVAGVLMRLTMLFSVPILEVDYHRYLWDGAQSAAGFSPYAVAPAAALEGGPAVPPELNRLAREAAAEVGRINHARLRTIYPPTAQGFFYLAHLLRPFSLTAWRLVLLAADGATLVLLLIVLRRLRMPHEQTYLYWCNPLLIKEIHNSGHMDVLLFPFLLAVFWCLMQNRSGWAGFFLALAAGVKIWPVLLLPLLLGAAFPDYRRLARLVMVFSGISAMLVVVSGFPGPLDASSGLLAYSRSWENNAGFFRLAEAGLGRLLPLVDTHPGHAQRLSRILTAVLLAGIAWTVALRKDDSPDALCRKALTIIAALFLLGPTQFPWYYTWLLPFLVIRPNTALLLPTLLLPLYYLRYHLEARGMMEFLPLVIGFEFLPVWGLLALDLTRRMGSHAGR